MLLSLFSEAFFLADFLKISLGPPFPLLRKMRVLGDLAKIAIRALFETTFSENAGFG